MSTRDKKILIILAGFMILALSYFLIFQKQNEQRDALEAENVNLTAKFNDLLEKAGHEDEYNAAITKMNHEFEISLKEYPSFLQVENIIMDVVGLETKSKSWVKGLTIDDPVAMDTDQKKDSDGQQEASTENTNPEVASTEDGSLEKPAETTEDDGDTNAISTASIQLYDMKTHIDFECNTSELKVLLDLIVKDTNRQSIDTLSVAYDEKGNNILCNVVYDAYFLYGLDKPYEDANIPSMTHGLKTMFPDRK